MILTESDKRILAEVQADASLGLRDLAERVAMSTSSIWRRIQDMEAAGIITGRVALADPDKVGLPVCLILQVNITEQTSETRGRFERFVAGHPNVLQCFAVTGECDYLLIVRVATVGAYERFLMDELLAQTTVASASSQLVLRQHKNATALPV